MERRDDPRTYLSFGCVTFDPLSVDSRACMWDRGCFEQQMAAGTRTLARMVRPDTNSTARITALPRLLLKHRCVVVSRRFG